MKNEIYWAGNRHSNCAEVLRGFGSWEELQGAFRCGIRLSNGQMANGIGRCASLKDFQRRITRSKVVQIGRTS